jgi:hypothetical protein
MEEMEETQSYTLSQLLVGAVVLVQLEMVIQEVAVEVLAGVRVHLDQEQLARGTQEEMEHRVHITVQAEVVAQVVWVAQVQVQPLVMAASV